MHEIKHGEKIIRFELEIKKVKHINLRVNPDMNVIVSANKDVQIEQIYNFVLSRADWIEKNVKLYKSTQSENDYQKEYVNGEDFKYLGKQYRLKIEQTNNIECVKLDKDHITVYVKNIKSIKRKEKLLNDWFHERAKLIFNECFDSIYNQVDEYVTTKPLLSLRIMKVRWGSCLRSKNTISLNLDLIKTPKFCIEYVILHELLHFIHPYHNSNFYQHLSILMPDWKKSKEILDEEMVKFV